MKTHFTIPDYVQVYLNATETEHKQRKNTLAKYYEALLANALRTAENGNYYVFVRISNVQQHTIQAYAHFLGYETIRLNDINKYHKQDGKYLSVHEKYLKVMELVKAGLKKPLVIIHFKDENSFNETIPRSESSKRFYYELEKPAKEPKVKVVKEKIVREKQIKPVKEKIIEEVSEQEKELIREEIQVRLKKMLEGK